MSTGFLGRVFRLGRALVSWGLGPEPASAPTTAVPAGVCVVRSIDAGASVRRVLAGSVAASGSLDTQVTVTRSLQGSIVVIRRLPEC